VEALYRVFHPIVDLPVGQIAPAHVLLRHAHLAVIQQGAIALGSDDEAGHDDAEACGRHLHPEAVLQEPNVVLALPRAQDVVRRAVGEHAL